MIFKINFFKILVYVIIIIISIFYLYRGVYSSYNSNSYPFDLTPSLVGTKNLIMKGIDPYSLEGRKLIEIAYYGRELTESDLLMRHQFYYPLYIIVFYYPFTFVGMPHSVFIIYIASFTLLVLTIILWSKAIFKLNNTNSWIVVLFFLITPIAYKAINTRQPFIVMFFLISTSIYLLIYHSNKYYYSIAGMLLFLSTIRPQNSLIIIGYIFLVFLPNLENRKLGLYVLLGFIIMGIFTLIITNYLSPGWINEFGHSLLEYKGYIENATGAEKLLGKGIHASFLVLLFGLIGLTMAIICFKYNNKSLHLCCISYLLILQGLIFPSLFYVLLMGIPIIALSIKRATQARKKKNKIEYFIILFILLLINFLMTSFWILELLRSKNYGQLIINHNNILNYFMFRTPFVILPFLLGLGIIIFIIFYKTRTHSLDTF
jgi:hypothetical protein